jgi:hypothetical protein
MNDPIPQGYLREPRLFADADPDIKLKAKVLSHTFSADQALAQGTIAAAVSHERVNAYDRGRRDMLNAILAPNPEVARKLHDIRCDEGIEFTNEHGKLSFDLLFWVTAVAEQLGIEPKEDENGEA